jgi:hypothetical protein
LSAMIQNPAMNFHTIPQSFNHESCKIFWYKIHNTHPKNCPIQVTYVHTYIHITNPF